MYGCTDTISGVCLQCDMSNTAVCTKCTPGYTLQNGQCIQTGTTKPAQSSAASLHMIYMAMMLVVIVMVALLR